MWKQIRNYNYEINENGIIRNLTTKNFKKAFFKKDGYYHIHLYVETQKVVSFLVHRLVAEVFIENKQNLPCVNHKDSNKINNNLNNLEWCTYSENNKHSYKYGNNSNKGTKNGFSKLTEEDVLYIRKSYKTNKELAEELNVAPNTISQVRNRISWKHI